MSGNGFPSTFRTQSSGNGRATRTELTVYNDTGSPLTRGTCVVDDGGGGFAYPTVRAADGTQSFAFQPNLLGVLAEDIADGASGQCVAFGVLDGIDTSALLAGYNLSCDASGALVYYGDPYTIYETGYVLVSAASGSMVVLPQRLLIQLHTHRDSTTGGALESGIQVVIDGGGNPVTTGDKFEIEVPFFFDITSATLIADQDGDIEVDLLRSIDSGTTYTSICASALPTLSSEAYSQDNTLTGWTTQLGTSYLLRYHVNSASTLTRCTVSLKGQRWS